MIVSNTQFIYLFIIYPKNYLAIHILKQDKYLRS